MYVATSAQQVRAGWLPRAILSGFAASAVMLIGFVFAYGLAALLAYLLRGEPAGPTTFGTWLYALIHNQVIDLGRSTVYLAVTAYFAGGILWALLYAGVAEPRLPGPAWWRGVLFSLVPAAVSLLVVLPALGAGPLGLALQAGPLPLVGNVLLHLLYGATLGWVYGPFGDRSADTFGPPSDADREWMSRAEGTAARTTVAGGVIGVLLGLGVLFLGGPAGGGLALGTAPTAFLAATVLGGLTVGALVGSYFGLPGIPSESR